MAKNTTSGSKPPKDIESVARKILDVLLLGTRISRDNCHTYGIAPKNASVHSYISHIRHYLHVPVITTREGCEVASYHMDNHEIQRFKDPEQRTTQRIEMILQIEAERKSDLLKRLENHIENSRKKGSLDEAFFSALNVIINRK